jgi:hypothetical protein
LPTLEHEHIGSSLREPPCNRESNHAASDDDHLK